MWQRPQHILTRLAHVHPVYFVEEPTIEAAIDAPEVRIAVDNGVTVLAPILPAKTHEAAGFSAANNPSVRALLTTYFADSLDGMEALAWYYTPMAYGALPATIKTSVTIYDAMDELANFRNAPQELRDQERVLMQAADLVFSGGPSLHESRKYRHPRAFCFPSGVDEAHFRYAGGPAPKDIDTLPSPIIGFYGVLDERLDYELLGRVADERPDWTLVMIGPVVKIGESELVQRPNIHYLGKRSYDELPRYLSRFDAAILPFADNEATRFISPTKTLEYLAGGKPVVSTPVRDVVDLYGDVVEIATTPQEFVAAIEKLWIETSIERSFRQQLVNAVLAKHNWDVITSRMLRLVHDCILGRPTFAAVLQDTATNPSPTTRPSVPGPAR